MRAVRPQAGGSGPRFPSGSGCTTLLFHSFFKSLVGKDVVVELKNDLR